MRRAEEPVHRLFSRLTPQVQKYFIESELSSGDELKKGLVGVCRDEHGEIDPVLYHTACNYLDRSLGLYDN